MSVQAINKFFKPQKGTLLRSLRGFTLIELLIVITIITALGITVLVALDPAGRLADARNARRQTDVDTILTAVHAAIVDNAGSYPSNMPAAGTERQLGTGNSTVCTTALVAGGCNTPAATACADLMTGTINLAAYMKTMTFDPLAGTTYDATKTGYSVARDSNGIITVRACAAEGAGVTIFSSR